MANGRCSTGGCSNSGQLRRGWCETCYGYWRRSGKDNPANRPGLNAKERQGTCSVTTCGYKGLLIGDGLCRPCYNWVRRHPGEDAAGRERRERGPANGQCTVVENGAKCTDAHDSHGMCPSHRSRWLLHGDPAAPLTRRARGEIEEILRRGATATTDDCVTLDGRGIRPAVRFGDERMNASRAVWIVANGDPGDAWVLHTCHRGVEGCINIRHLYLGDQQQNTADMVGAGRQARGEGNGYSRLTAEKVREIRRRHKPRDPVNGGRALAAEFGVSETAVSFVVTRRTWAWLADS